MSTNPMWIFHFSFTVTFREEYEKKLVKNNQHNKLIKRESSNNCRFICDLL